MLSDRRIILRCGRTKDCRPADGFRTCPPIGEPLVRVAAPSDGRRGGGSIVGVLDMLVSSTGESVKLPRL